MTRPVEMGFPERIEMIRRTSMGVPKQLKIDLGLALINQEYNLAGNLFYIISSPKTEDCIEVRFNKMTEPAFTLYRFCGLNTPFDKFYITTPAGQSGTMTILYGSEAPHMLFPITNRIDIDYKMPYGDIEPETWGVEKTIGVAAVQLLIANTDRKACCLQAKSTNTHPIFIGFDDTVLSTKWAMELIPAAALICDDYRGPFYGISTAADQKLAASEW